MKREGKERLSEGGTELGAESSSKARRKKRIRPIASSKPKKSTTSYKKRTGDEKANPKGRRRSKVIMERESGSITDI